MIDAIEVLGDAHVFINTKTPDPGAFPLLGGHNDNQIWYGPAQYLLKVGHEGFVKNPVGCGPHKIKEYKPGDRIVFERWEEFWSDYAYWPKPNTRPWSG